MARNVKAPLAGWFACTCGLIAVALLAYGNGSVQRLDATVLARFVNGSVIIPLTQGAGRL